MLLLICLHHVQVRKPSFSCPFLIIYPIVLALSVYAVLIKAVIIQVFFAHQLNKRFFGNKSCVRKHDILEIFCCFYGQWNSAHCLVLLFLPVFLSCSFLPGPCLIGAIFKTSLMFCWLQMKTVLVAFGCRMLFFSLPALA